MLDEIATLDQMIPSDTDGIELFLRNKRPQNVDNFGAVRTVLFVHGATYPSNAVFDFPIDGISWMDYIAGHGFDVWSLDLRGYGLSTRPVEMEAPPEANAPLVDTETARRDVGRAIDHIFAERDLSQLCLIGYSWGTAIMGGYTAEHMEQVHKLVLLAPTWKRQAGYNPLGSVEGAKQAYRLVDQAAVKARFYRGVAPELHNELIAAEDLQRWLDLNWAQDPQANDHQPAKLRAPTGVLKDLVEYASTGKLRYDTSKITCPVLIPVGEWDADTPPEQAQQLFEDLTHTLTKRLVLIGRATHSLPLERKRLQLFKEVQNFLEED